MPQITVTLDDETYMDLIHNLPKGLKSKFVTRAVAKAVMECGRLGQVMHAYARNGEHRAHEVYNALLAAQVETQTKLGLYDRDEKCKCGAICYCITDVGVAEE